MLRVKVEKVESHLNPVALLAGEATEVDVISSIDANDKHSVDITQYDDSHIDSTKLYEFDNSQRSTGSPIIDHTEDILQQQVRSRRVLPCENRHSIHFNCNF